MNNQRDALKAIKTKIIAAGKPKSMNRRIEHMLYE